MGITLKAKLRRTKKNNKKTKLPIHQYYWSLGKKFQVSIESKLVIYKQILNSVRLCDIQLWGCVTLSKCKHFLNRVLRNIAHAPRYVQHSDDLHRDLEISTVEEEIKRVGSWKTSVQVTCLYKCFICYITGIIWGDWKKLNHWT